MSSYRVKASALNLRSKPKVVPSTKIASLHNGQFVEKIGETSDPLWWLVSTKINGISVEGYLNNTYLAPIAAFVVPASAQGVTAIHLSPTKTIGPTDESGRAYPLNMADLPRRTSTSNQDKVSELHKIINWLSVDTSARYLPQSGTTYCNIYTYDYCYLSGVYLPRVWWTSKAIAQLIQDQSVMPTYGETLKELNANSLHDWLGEYGDDFGWRRVFDLTELQNEANNGSVCVISAQRKELNRPGHICLVVPETEEYKAVRSGLVVTSPVQSNAGASNFRYGVRVWWTSDKFSSFSFWVHK